MSVGLRDRPLVAAATPAQSHGLPVARNGLGGGDTAYKKVRAYQNNTSKASPIPLENCAPLCSDALSASLILEVLAPNPNKPENLWRHQYRRRQPALRVHWKPSSAHRCGR